MTTVVDDCRARVAQHEYHWQRSDVDTQLMARTLGGYEKARAHVHGLLTSIVCSLLLPFTCSLVVIILRQCQR